MAQTAYLPVSDKLIDTVRACLMPPQTYPDGLEVKLILNKVKARGVYPTDQEFKAALNRLAENGVARRRTRKRVEFWGLTR